MMNVQQRQIFDVITAVIDAEIEGELFFIDELSETEKTFVKNLLLSYVRSTDEIALSITSFNIASILFNDNCTAHSHFKISLDIQQNNTCDIKAQTSLADLIRRIKLII